MDQWLLNQGGLGGLAVIASLAGPNGADCSNLMIVDPLNTNNNTTKNSFQTKDILKKFYIALSSLKSLIGKSTSSPGITQSPLEQFLNLD